MFFLIVDQIKFSNLPCERSSSTSVCGVLYSQFQGTRKSSNELVITWSLSTVQRDTKRFMEVQQHKSLFFFGGGGMKVESITENTNSLEGKSNGIELRLAFTSVKFSMGPISRGLN